MVPQICSTQWPAEIHGSPRSPTFCGIEALRTLTVIWEIVWKGRGVARDPYGLPKTSETSAVDSAVAGGLPFPFVRGKAATAFPLSWGTERGVFSCLLYSTREWKACGEVGSGKTGVPAAFVDFLLLLPAHNMALVCGCSRLPSQKGSLTLFNFSSIT